MELIAELPPQRGMGAQLAKVLRAAASGSVVPAKTLASRIALGVGSTPRTPLEPQRPIRTIVVGAEDSETGEQALAVALGLGAMLGTALHVVSAYGVFRASTDADAILEAATQSARARSAGRHARAPR